VTITSYWAGSVAVVTGAGAGIGRALAMEAARRGAKVVVSDVEVDAAVGVADEITRSGGEALPVFCDVTDAASIDALAATTVSSFGQVNLVCANAGVGAGGTIEDVAAGDARWVLEVNLIGTYDTLRAFARSLREASQRSQRAHVLTTGSEHSLGVPPHVGPMTAYTTTKHAVLGLSDAVRRDLGPAGVTVSILCPSYVGTEGWNAKRNRPDRYGGPVQADPALRERLAAIGQPADAVAGIAFDGMERGDFIIVTNDVSRDFALARNADVERAFGRLDDQTTD
jgi:NAD(P)-dependent dehydrogenase (short-subunit alcohol dehydrogenase family)